MDDVLEHPDHFECMTCGHEWATASKPDQADGPRVVKDAYGTVLADGDSIRLIKDLKLRGSTQVIKGGTKARASLWWTATMRFPARSKARRSA